MNTDLSFRIQYNIITIQQGKYRKITAMDPIKVPSLESIKKDSPMTKLTKIHKWPKQEDSIH